MKTWNKTTIIWNCHLGLKTNILVDDWHKKSEKHFHRIHELRATQLPDKNVSMQLNIRRVCISPTTKRSDIRSRLIGLSTSGRSVYLTDIHNTQEFFLTFELKKGESFCASAIDMVSSIFKVFGVDDEKKFCVADFIIIQETQVKSRDKWIPFADFLRHKRGWPQACGLYGYKLRIGDLVISVNYKESVSNFYLK